MEKGLVGMVDDAEMAPELQRIVDMVNAQVKKPDVVDRIVKAGKTAMFDPEMSKQLMQGVIDAEDKPTIIGQGVAGLVMTLAKQSRGTMPHVEMAQAAQILLMEALDALIKAGVVEGSTELVDGATMAMMEPLTGAMGATKEKMGNLMSNTQSVLDDPQKMAAFEASQGKPAQPAPEAPNGTA